MNKAVQAIFGLIILGVVMYIVEMYIPMDGMIRLVIRVVIVLVICGYLLSLFGFGPWGKSDGTP